MNKKTDYASIMLSAGTIKLIFIAVNEISGCRKGKENLKNKMK